MKTPIQTLIEQVKAEIAFIDDDPSVRAGLKSALRMIEEQLPSEREAIEGAYDKGAANEAVPYPLYDDGKDYFTTKYNDNE